MRYRLSFIVPVFSRAQRGLDRYIPNLATHRPRNQTAASGQLQVGRNDFDYHGPRLLGPAVCSRGAPHSSAVWQGAGGDGLSELC